MLRVKGARIESADFFVFFRKAFEEKFRFGKYPAVNHYNIRIKLAAILIAALLAFSCGGGGGGGGGAVTSWHKAESGGMHNGGDAGGWGSSPNPAPGFAPNNSGSSITSDEKLISQMAAIDNVTSIRLDLIVNGKPQQTIVADANTTKDVLPPIKPEDTVSGTAYIYVAGEESPRIAMLEETVAGLNKPLPFKVPYYYKAFDFSNTQVASGTYYTRDGINLAEFTPDGYGWKCREDGSVHAGPFVSGVRGDIELELVDASGRPAPKLYVKADFDASSPTSYTIDETLARDFAAGATPAAGSGSVIVTPLPAGTLYTETQSGNAVTSTGYHVTVTIDGTPFNINFIPSDTAAVPIINVPQGATITASASADITGGTGTTASLDLASTASATMQPGGGTLTMYARYPLTCQVQSAHWANASISGTVPTFYTNTSPATALPSATAQYTNVSNGKIMRFIGWALQNNGTPVITGDTIPSTYKGALTLYACYGECSLTITGAALPATGDPVLASGDTLALTAVPEGFPAGQTITYSWRVLPLGSAPATVSGSGANATVTPVAGASGSATVEVAATCGSLSASAMKNVTVVDFSVTGDTVINMSDTGKMLTASVAGYTGTIEYTWNFSGGSVSVPNGQTGANRTFNPVSGGKTTVTVGIRLVNENITLPAKTIGIYVFDINLNGTGLTTPTPTNTNYGFMLTTADTAGKTITASLNGSGLPAVTYTWTCADPALNYIIMDDSGSASGTFTVKPRAAGTASFSVMANYNGTVVCTKTVDVAVAGLTLTGSGTHEFINASPVPTGANDIALTATLGGIAPDALTSAGITFESSDPTIATVTAGSASGTSRPATVTALKGGKVTITAKATIAATNTELTVTKEITIIRLIVKDGDDNDVPATGNSLADGPVTLTAEFEGLTEGVDFSWAYTPASGSDINITTTSGPTTTVSGTSGTATVTLTATYDGSDYTKDIGFALAYVVNVANLDPFLSNLEANDANTPVEILITGLNTSNWTQIKDILKSNTSKYVDLSLTTLPEGITDMSDSFKGCGTMVKAPKLPATVTTLKNCFEDCVNLTETPDLTVCTDLQNLRYAFRDCDKLASASSIPEKVSNMIGCFQSCDALTGTIIVKTTSVDEFYWGDAFLSITPANGLVVKVKNDTVKDRILASGNNNSSYVTVVVDPSI